MATVKEDYDLQVSECKALLEARLKGLGFVLIVFDDDPAGCTAYTSNRSLRPAMREVSNTLRGFIDGDLKDDAEGDEA